MFESAILHALDGPGHLATPTYQVTGQGDLPSLFDVSGLACAVIGAVCAEANASLGVDHPIEIDRFLSGEWFTFFNEPIDWAFPPVWDDVAGVYRTNDGFIRLHTNAPHHKAATLSVLNCPPDREKVAARVKDWDGDALENAIVAAKGCAATLRSIQDWLHHPQGQAVAREPLIAWANVGQTDKSPKPLHDTKILDLTRVLAGPVATRTLAGFGAQVLRIDPPGWEEGICEPEVTWGKRLATLDLKTDIGRETFLALLAEADIFIHGLRADALDDLGLDENVRRTCNPDLIDIAHNAYGWTGPWSQRRGFDSLVQMSCGIAHAGMVDSDAESPVPLPVQALDYGTGYLIAAAALRALRIRNETGQVMRARLSLARTAALLMQKPGPGLGGSKQDRQPHHFQSRLISTHWGSVRSLKWPGPIPMNWALPARPFHSDAPEWV